MSVLEKLPSNDLAKILFFMFIQIVTCLLLFWGVLPTIFLFVAYLLSRRDKSLSMLNKAIVFARRYTLLSIVIGISIILLNLLRVFTDGEIDMSPYLNNAFIGFFIILVVGIPYLIVLKHFFYKPLSCHQAFVAENGIFGSSSRSQKELSILKTENMKSYSVADELLKWKELKDQGLVTEKEFEEMKRKIMGG